MAGEGDGEAGVSDGSGDGLAIMSCEAKGIGEGVCLAS